MSKLRFNFRKAKDKVKVALFFAGLIGFVIALTAFVIVVIESLINWGGAL